MAVGKVYLGDEVHELAAELDTIRAENELLKMLSERKDQEISMLREQLDEAKSKYAEAFTESLQIRTLLEQMAQTLTSGLQRYHRRKDRASKTAEEPPAARIAAPVAPVRETETVQSSRPFGVPDTPREDIPEEATEPPPSFSSRDPRLPNVSM